MTHSPPITAWFLLCYVTWPWRRLLPHLRALWSRDPIVALAWSFWALPPVAGGALLLTLHPQGVAVSVLVVAFLTVWLGVWIAGSDDSAGPRGDEHGEP